LIERNEQQQQQQQQQNKAKCKPGGTLRVLAGKNKRFLKRLI
jgi:hypothetical protein